MTTAKDDAKYQSNPLPKTVDASQPHILPQSKYSATIIPGVIRISGICQLKYEDRYLTGNNYPVWFKEISENKIKSSSSIFILHDFIFHSLAGNFADEKWEDFIKCHREMKNIFQQLVLNHLKFCCEKNVESYFWKTLYYNLIRVLRQKADHKCKLVTIIEDGLKLYLKLFRKVKQKFVEKSLTAGQLSKFKTIANVSSQKFLICLGDLSRYKAKTVNENEYDNAFSFYHRARSLIPTNGIPYNQLAVLSVRQGNKLDAIYYYMRSLMSSNAIFSARESLKVLFDEIRKEYEVNQNKHCHSLSCKLDESMLREETWLYPDTILKRDKCCDRFNEKNTTKKEQNASESEIIHNFTFLYLYIIGKLFSGIGLENINDLKIKLSIQLDFLLCTTPLIFSRPTLLKIAALNIFVVEHNKKYDMSKAVCYSFNILNYFFGLLLHKANSIISKYEELDIIESELFDLNSLLQFTKVWCDWLSLHAKFWKPYLNKEQLAFNPWKELQKLFCYTKKIEENFKLKQNHSSVLEEDQFLYGFSPIFQKTHFYLTQKLPSEVMQLQTRLLKISEIYLIFQESKDFLPPSCFDSDYPLSQKKTPVNKKFEDYDVKTVASTCNAEIGDTHKTSNESNQILQFAKLKRELEIKNNITNMFSRTLYEILKVSKIHIYVKPKYLLLDTNCFIDNFEDIQKLSRKLTRYTIIVPLTVVKELDGLSKGIKMEEVHSSKNKKHRVQHFDDVSTRAKKSLEFIKNSANNIRSATSNGSIINSSLFGLVKDMRVSNDDKILATACALSKTMSAEKYIDKECFIQTELVLITTDRNLRVKALSRNLVVSELNDVISYDQNFC